MNTYVFPLILNQVSAHCLWAVPKSPRQQQPSWIGVSELSLPPLLSSSKWQILQSLSIFPKCTFTSKSPLSKSTSDELSEMKWPISASRTPSISPENWPSPWDPQAVESKTECHDWSSESSSTDMSLQLPAAERASRNGKELGFAGSESPRGASTADILWNPDGEMAFDWRKTKRYVLTNSTGKHGGPSKMKRLRRDPWYL